MRNALIPLNARPMFSSVVVVVVRLVTHYAMAVALTGILVAQTIRRLSVQTARIMIVTASWIVQMLIVQAHWNVLILTRILILRASIVTKLIR
jgi:hypothetical protein